MKICLFQKLFYLHTFLYNRYNFLKIIKLFAFYKFYILRFYFLKIVNFEIYIILY